METSRASGQPCSTSPARSRSRRRYRQRRRSLVVAEIPALDAPALAAWRGKKEASERILVATNPLVHAWNRYADWVDLGRGPTGKEKGAGGFASIDHGRIVAAIEESRSLAGAEPKVAALDELLLAYADGMEKALPVAVEASGYYARKDFLGDKWRAGRRCIRVSSPTTGPSSTRAPISATGSIKRASGWISASWR